MNGLLLLAFFLSGASALVFEGLWFRQAGLALGNSVWASSLVLSSFMAGLATGNALAVRVAARPRLLRAYAGLEAIVAVAGVAIVFGLPGLGDLLSPVARGLQGQPWLLNAWRIVVSFLVLCIPTTAMGMTLPVLASALTRLRASFGEALGALYGSNTLGAVAGALAGETLLIPSLGVRGAALGAAAANGLAALIALGLSAFHQRQRAAPAAGGGGSLRLGMPRRLLLAAFLSGGALLGLEVAGFRFLLPFVIGTSLTFAVMLAVILAGIALGGLVASRWLRHDPEAPRFLAALAFGAGIAVVACYSSFGRVLALMGITYVHGAAGVAALAATVLFPVSLLSGTIFTLIGSRIHQDIGEASAAASRLTLANTLGAMLGALAAGFWLLPSLGVEGCFAVLAGVYGAVAACCLVAFDKVRRRGASVLTGALGLAYVSFLLLFPWGLMRGVYIKLSLFKFAGVGHPEAETRIAAAREGLTETAVYLEEREHGETRDHRLVTNGFSMSTTRFGARRYMSLFVYLPVALHPGIRRALLISYGVGCTADALVHTPEIESIDVVDISRDILDLGRVPYPASPLLDPRVRAHVEDGRQFLLNTAVRYDLITAEPPPPKLAGVENLYSEEYFRLVRERLAEGGMVSYWLPAHGLSPRDTQVLLRAFCNAFEDCSLWNGMGLDWVLLGTRGAAGAVSPRRFEEQWLDGERAARLVDVGLETPEQLGALFMADAEKLRTLIADAPPLRDNWPHRLGPLVANVVAPVYRSLMETDAAREAFGRSRLIAALWPAVWKERTLPSFDLQRLYNNRVWGSLDASRRSTREDLHRVLTETRLRTLVVLLLESDPDLQRMARAKAARGEWDAWVLGQTAIAAMADRNYGLAAEQARRSLDQDPSSGLMRFVAVYALCLNGRGPEARARMAAVDLDASTRAFLGSTCADAPRAVSP